MGFGAGYLMAITRVSDGRSGYLMAITRVSDGRVERDAHRAGERATVLASGKVASSPSSPCSAHAVPACACAWLRVAPALSCPSLCRVALRSRGRWAYGASGGGLWTPDGHRAGGTAVPPKPSYSAGINTRLGSRFAMPIRG